ncbi:TolC family protein [Vibrio sp. SCSIO 43137]|uniref:TolC family protein n=1 Tax=Vibrio sp. SCSIO 43137 TaxID=3021011 RepID=UPI0023077CA9|nr:TolC family protein [Vibrio sp. SCSIO 43137]WCE31170.1 TolC family protein [Vibrio sp. SCSIO 43137]
MITHKIRFTTLLVAFAVSPFSHSAEISFEQAWQLLQDKNNPIAASKANVDRYKHLQQSKQALNYPTISVGANYTRLDSDVTVNGEQLLDSLDSASRASLGQILAGLAAGNPALAGALSGLNPVSTIAEKDLFTSSIRATWPLFTGGRITAAQNIAAGQTDEAVAQLKIEVLAQYEDLAKYYFSVVLARQVLQTRQSVEAGLTKHRNFALKMEKQGQIAKVERLQAEASLAKAVVDRKKAEKDVEIAVSALSQILNQNEKVLPNTELFINQSLPPKSAFTEQTLNTYPGLDLLAAKKKQATNLIKAEKGRYFPQVMAYGNYTLHEDDTLASEMAPDWMVGIGVSLPLVDSSGRSENMQAAQSAVLQINHLNQQAVKDLTLLVEKTYFEAQQAVEEAEGLQVSITLADENLKLRNRAFSQGLSTSLEVVDAELYLAGVKTQQELARFNYLIALNKLLALSNEINTYNQYERTAYQPVNDEATQ